MPTPVVFNNTVLRDGHQSLAATRMTTAQMLPAAPVLDELGFGGLETWGGATIDSCLRYLGENPFDRLRALKKAAPKTPQLMLLRGQNIVQYTSFPDDVVEAFVKANAAAGQDVFRIFDALNDVRNLQTAIEAVLAAGKHPRGEICYTTSPVHTIEAFVKLGTDLEKLGCKSIGIKDMSGVIAPRIAYNLVAELKRKVGIPIILHTHDTAGLGAAAYVAAVDAGVDAVETSIAPFANGTAQPDTVRMVALLEGHPRCPRFDTAKLQWLREYFTGVYKELGKFTSPDNERVDSDTLCYQVPGGMLSNFRNQLKEQGMSDKFEQVMAEIPVVRQALGWIPLVTPTSQIVGTQAMLNVKFGRWKNLAPAAADIALGKYGKTPGPVSTELLELIEKRMGQKPIEGRPADLLSPRMPKLREELAAAGLPTDDEACVLHAMFPREFAALHKKPAGTPAAAPAAAAPAPAASGRPSPNARHYALTVNGQRQEAWVEEMP
ncbi:pyruvate carboxylase subunit B [Nibricoccus sp. IMCC34717]|uniref:pyruvate carboxylase subunit B n=1 Tax=Nibricoccus sp. IMCC34717 TaxID=3034021 RepID=UPI00384EDE81